MSDSSSSANHWIKDMLGDVEFQVGDVICYGLPIEWQKYADLLLQLPDSRYGFLKKYGEELPVAFAGGGSNGEPSPDSKIPYDLRKAIDYAMSYGIAYLKPFVEDGKANIDKSISHVGFIIKGGKYDTAEVVEAVGEGIIRRPLIDSVEPKVPRHLQIYRNKHINDKCLVGTKIHNAFLEEVDKLAEIYNVKQVYSPDADLGQYQYGFIHLLIILRLLCYIKKNKNTKVISTIPARQFLLGYFIKKNYQALAHRPTLICSHLVGQFFYDVVHRLAKRSDLTEEDKAELDKLKIKFDNNLIYQLKKEEPYIDYFNIKKPYYPNNIILAETHALPPNYELIKEGEDKEVLIEKTPRLGGAAEKPDVQSEGDAIDIMGTSFTNQHVETLSNFMASIGSAKTAPLLTSGNRNEEALDLLNEAVAFLLVIRDHPGDEMEVEMAKKLQHVDVSNPEHVLTFAKAYVVVSHAAAHNEGSKSTKDEEKTLKSDIVTPTQEGNFTFTASLDATLGSIDQDPMLTLDIEAISGWFDATVAYALSPGKNTLYTYYVKLVKALVRSIQEMHNKDYKAEFIPVAVDTLRHSNYLYTKYKGKKKSPADRDNCAPLLSLFTTTVPIEYATSPSFVRVDKN